MIFDMSLLDQLNKIDSDLSEKVSNLRSVEDIIQMKESFSEKKDELVKSCRAFEMHQTMRNHWWDKK